MRLTNRARPCPSPSFEYMKLLALARSALPLRRQNTGLRFSLPLSPRPLPQHPSRYGCVLCCAAVCRELTFIAEMVIELVRCGVQHDGHNICHAGYMHMSHIHRAHAHAHKDATVRYGIQSTRTPAQAVRTCAMCMVHASAACAQHV